MSSNEQRNDSLGSLLVSARGGDRASFDRLFNRYRPAVQSYVRKRVEESEVDDILQDVAIAAWRALPTFEGRSAIKTWLVALANYKLRDYYRRGVRRTVPLEDVAHDLGVTDTALVDVENRQTIGPVIDGLPPPKGAILTLYYGQRLTFDEIATNLSMPASTVKYHFYQAHAAVAAALKGELA
jgi:RNA polymerase sigma-70 factor (ECF subfamily)